MKEQERIAARLLAATAPIAAVGDLTLRLIDAVTAFIREGDRVTFVPVVKLEVERGGKRQRVELVREQERDVVGCRLRLDRMTDVELSDAPLQSAVDLSIWFMDGDSVLNEA